MSQATKKSIQKGLNLTPEQRQELFIKQLAQKRESIATAIIVNTAKTEAFLETENDEILDKAFAIADGILKRVYVTSDEKAEE